MNTKDARAAARFAQIIERDDLGRVVKVRVPGHEGRSYIVVIGHPAHRTDALCLQDLGPLGTRECLGNGRGVCYHVQTAILAAAGKTHSVKFCKTCGDATRAARLGGWAYRLVSRRSGETLWMVVSERGAK